MTAEEAFHELLGYTLAHRDPAFIHQYAVDAFAAQTADARTKPIKLTFALVGLCLHLEHGFSGKQVQRAHMKLARQKQPWPSLPLPANRGSVTVLNVIAEPPGPGRDQAIQLWMRCVWQTFAASHPAMAALLRENEII